MVVNGDETIVLGLHAVQHHPLTLAFVWAAPTSATLTVSEYRWTFDGPGVPNDSVAHTGGTSESVRFSGLTALAWYTFSVYARFDDGTNGTTASVTAQAPDVVVVPPLASEPGSCAAVESALADGDKVSYTGQCHSGSWSYYTLDARERGGSSVIVSPEPDGVSTAVCGHDATKQTPNSEGTMLWCNEGEWVSIGGDA